MAEVLRERWENVAILTLNRPVANVLSPSLRTALKNELDAAIADMDVAAIVLCGAGPDFSAGIDVTEYDTTLAKPWLNDLCLQVEMSPKPIVAAMHGTAVGGGFELALAAHKRVAQAGTQIAFPEIDLGLIPGGGATQRLPRMVGVDAALDLLMTGRAVDVADPVLQPLIDEIVESDPVETAKRLAQNAARAGDWIRAQDQTGGLGDPLAYQEKIASLMAKRRDYAPAEIEIIRCVEAAQLLPFRRGLELEQVIFEERRKAKDARARRHYHTAERRTLIMPERAHGRARKIARVAIPGFDGLEIELAVMCLDAGMHVALTADDMDATHRAFKRIDAIYAGAVARHVLPAQAKDALMARLSACAPDEAFRGADLVLDTGAHDLRTFHADVDATAIWVCVSDGQPMPATAPQRLTGQTLDIRVYRPVLSTKLIEMCVPSGTSADVVATLVQFFGRMGRTVVRCECVEGLVGDNMSSALYAAALALAQSGLAIYRIDAAARVLGFSMGPFRLMDQEGLVRVAERLKRRAIGSLAPDISVLEQRIASGAQGRISGRGFYFHDDKGVHPDPDLRENMHAVPPHQPIEPRSALEAALINEAARLISANVVQRASDIDVVMVKGLGFDWRRGGPLFQADLHGLFAVVGDMKRCTEISEPLWRPHGMIEDMVKNGEGFFGRQGVLAS